jgi:D-alanyl-D-alanine-carboxypeptidase/D-alanyl-D-alanine-endopeptidase
MMRFILLAAAFALGMPGAAGAADDPVLAEAADLSGFVMFLDSGAPGMVFVVVRGDATLMRFYGETEKGNHRLPGGTSVLRLNSVTKVFTTEVVAALAAEGKLSLTDPLQRFAGDVKVPQFNQRPITLLDLATHSARGREPARLADIQGSLGLAAQLRAALGAGHGGRLFQCGVRPAGGRGGKGGRSELC